VKPIEVRLYLVFIALRKPIKSYFCALIRESCLAGVKNIATSPMIAVTQKEKKLVLQTIWDPLDGQTSPLN
jgi:hypothetical protein